MSAEEITEKIDEYSQFVSEKLRPELLKAETSRDETRTEINEYNSLLKQLTGFREEKKSEFETVVNLGHGTIYCNAVAKLDMIYVHVGMGFHVEMTIPEAIQFVQQRLTFLKNAVLQGKEVRVREITDHVIAAAAILDELEQELQRSG
jgi:prefoldin subunit 5